MIEPDRYLGERGDAWRRAKAPEARKGAKTHCQPARLNAMRRRICTILLAIGALACCGADEPKPRFGLYLVKVPDADLAQAELESRPLLTEQDLASYDWQTHALTLTESAKKKISDLKVGVSGKQFVIVADRQRCYQGAFWTGLSSISHDHPVIEVDNFNADGKGLVVEIQRAYPTAKFAAAGDDPRPDPRILCMLTALGKIKNAEPSAPAKGASSSK